MGLLDGPNENQDELVKKLNIAVEGIGEHYKKVLKKITSADQMYNMQNQHSKWADYISRGSHNQQALLMSKERLGSLLYPNLERCQLSPEHVQMAHDTLDYMGTTIPAMFERKREELIQKQKKP